MSYPALDDFDAEDVHDSVRRVYTALRKHRDLALVFFEPRQVKSTHVAEVLHMRPHRVSKALDWLTEHRYLVERGRYRHSRMLVLVHDRVAIPNVHVPAA